MKLTLVPALDFNLPELAGLLNAGFSGYLVDIKFTPVLINAFLKQDQVDLTLSQVALAEGRPVGVALIARRGWTSRLAAMGIASEWRGQGMGHWLMTQIIVQARERHDRLITLEVIEQNAPAVHLYRQVGFQVQRRLVGYRATQPEGHQAQADLQEVDLREVARFLTAWAAPDLPWQLAGESLAQGGWPARGYCLGPAYGAISDPAQPHIAVKALAVPPEARRQGLATKLLRALITEYSGKSWFVPPLWPEEFAAGLFEKSGFTREALTQLQMSLVLI